MLTLSEMVPACKWTSAQHRGPGISCLLGGLWEGLAWCLSEAAAKCPCKKAPLCEIKKLDLDGKGEKETCSLIPTDVLQKSQRTGKHVKRASIRFSDSEWADNGLTSKKLHLN